MRLPQEPDIPPQINIVPMIDVIFAILTFFIVSSLFLTRQEGLPVNLPSAATAQQEPSAQITVTLDAKGRISVQNQRSNIYNVQQQVASLIPSNQEAIVVVNADEAVTHGRVVAVMDKLRQIQGVRLAIGTQQP